MNQERTEKLYSRCAPIYDLVFGLHVEKGRAHAIELLGLRPGERVLELGVGTGLLLPHYPAGVHVTGIDMSQGMLERAERRAKDLALPNVEVRRMDAARLAFPDNAFDTAIGAYFLNIAPDPVRVVREASRVVKPGGTILFLNHFRSENPWISRVEKIIAPACKRIGFSSALGMKETLAHAPLETLHIEETSWLKCWKIVKCRNAK